MAIATAKQLCQGLLTKTLGSIYTPPINHKAIIKEILLCNVGSIDVTVTIYIVNKDHTPYLGNMIFNTLSVGVGKTVVMGGMTTVLEDGGSVQAVTSDNNSVNITISGAEVTP